MEVTRISGHSGVGGVFVNSEIVSAFTCTGEIIFDWDRVEKPTFTRLCTAIRQGFSVSRGGPVEAILTMLDNIDGVPKIPSIGYMGKKNMHVLVPNAKAEQYQQDLIAAAHMVDVDLTKAMAIRRCDDWAHKYSWLYVNGWEVAHHVKPDEVPKSRNRWRNDGGHLKPATSKLANMVRLWQEELLPERQKLLDWIERKPPLTFHLQTGLDV